MGLRRALLGVFVCALGAVPGCGPAPEDGLPPETPPVSAPAEVAAEEPAPSLEAAPALVLNDARKVRPRLPPAPPPDAFQPGFHQALRGSEDVGSLTTFRLRVPVGRSGSRVRVTFRSGDGQMTLQRATVAKAGENGALASTPVPLTFNNGKAGFSLAKRTLATSDPVAFPVAFRDELAITFEVQGAVAESIINAFPGSYARTGTSAMAQGPLGGTAWEKALGVATVDVEGPPGRAFVAIGDSITEGYMDEHNDTRNAWPALVEKQLGVPVVNSGASGQGFYDADLNLSQEVLSLQGITDCIVLLGTNDLGSELSDEQLIGRMNTLLDNLEPFCRPWVSTLLPKEKSNHGDYDEVKRQRLVFNAWIRQQQRAEVIDLEAVTRQPNNVHLFIDGLEVDGIHASAEGHRVMAAEVTRVLRERGGL